MNRKKQVRNLRTCDFSTLYTCIPHKQLIIQLSRVIKDSFIASKKSCIRVYKNDAKWTDSPKKTTLALDCEKVIFLLSWLIDNIYVTFGDKVFSESQWVLIVLLFLPICFYRIGEQRVLKNYSTLNAFKNCCRYIDDLLMTNNDDYDECDDRYLPEGTSFSP